ncbi:MAG: hypothetical protein RI958_522 [Actinomycetota bacterium]
MTQHDQTPLAPGGSPRSKTTKTRAERRRFRLIALGLGTATAVLAAAIVVVVVAVGDRAGTLVSPVDCSRSTAGNLRFEPTTGAEGTSVYLTGANFADVTDIMFNGKSVNSFSIISATEISTAVPGGATSGPIEIVSRTTPIISDTCFTTTSPAIASFSPASGAAGTVVTITGANFSGATAVKFNGSPTPPTSVTATSITVTVPPNAVKGLISVETPVSTGVSATTFSISSAAITEFSPAIGAAGTEVTITGANLSGASAVRFGSTPASSFRNVSATTVVATVPANVTTGPISIATPAGTATASADFAAPPTITSFTPTTASPGSTVTITGTNLQSVTSVDFVGSAAATTFTIDSPTQITATVPADATTGQISVLGTALAVSSTPIVIGPSISSIWPTSGPAGTVVSITGFNLVRLTGVTFNGVAAPFQEISSTQATATLPAGVTAGPVTVRTAAGNANSPIAFGPQTPPTLSVDPPGPVSVATGSSTTTEPAATEPVTTEPATTEPPTTDPATTDPAATDPAATDPATTEPPTTEPPTTEAAAAVPAPATLSNGQIVLSDQAGASAASGSGSPSWSGTAQATFGSLRVPVSVSYTDAANWVLTASDASATITVGPVTLAIGSITGSITATPQATVWDLRGALAATATLVADSGATPTGKLALLGGTVAIRPACPTFAEQTSLCPADDTTSVYLTLDADGTAAGSGFFANLGSGVPLQAVGAYQAAVNLSSSAFVMQGLFDPTASAVFAADAVSMTGLSIKVAANETTFAALPGDITVDSGTANSGLDVLVQGDGRVSVPKIGAFNLARLSAAYIGGGFVTVGTLSNKADLAGARMGSIAYFGAQQDTSAKVLDTIVMVPPQTYMFTGSMPTPKWLSDNLGVPKSDFGAYATYTISGLIKITAVIPASLKLPPIPRIKTTVTAFTLTAIINIEPAVGAETGFEIAANGTMTIDGNAPVGLVLAARSVSKCTAIAPAMAPPSPITGKVPTTCVAEASQSTIALSAVGDNGSAVWPDIFGVPGLNLNSAAIQIGLTPGIFPFVSIGLAGSGALPGKLREYMGIDSNDKIPVSFVMNLSAVSPCLSVSVGEPNSATPILALPPKTQVVTATYVSFLVSPYGCSVGVFDVPAGVQIRTKAKVLQATVDLFGSYDPNPGGPPGMKTPQLRAWLTIATPATDKNARVDLSLRVFAAAGGWNPNPRVELTGGLKIGGAARIEVFGNCSIDNCMATGSGEVSILGFNLGMQLTVKNLFTPLMRVEASGALRMAGSEVMLSGSIQPATNSFSFSGSGNFPSGSLLKSFEVELAQIVNPPRVVNGSPVIDPPTLRARFRASGSLGGRFRDASGTSGNFSTGWVDLTPNLSEVNFVLDTKLDLGLITVPTTMGFIVCLSGPCAGRVTPKFSFSSSFKGIPFNIPDTAIGNDWGFDAATSAYFSGSDKVGNNWGGLKGSFSGDVRLGVSSASGLSVDSSVKVTAYAGAGGKWNKLGTYSADVDISGAAFRFCKSLKGRKICIP